MTVFEWLTEQLALHMVNVELRFGARDESWVFLGFALHENGPHIRYLGPQGHKFLSIELQSETAVFPDLNRLQYQLAHETVHLLAPGGPGVKAPLIEEGLATLYSLDCGMYYDADYPQRCRECLSETYARALGLVQELLALDENAITRLRQVEPCFAAMTPDLIRSVLPQVPVSLAEQLCEIVDMR